ncbi:hypothetical protein CJU90_5357 [Yarrowia sp. C11]|nr:hypothetical protein CJU90_5357 [Yarrowia sp. C11]KAG5363960.1 hypothetical protein CKK34_2736 [Yarrowia sp. E02]
MLPPELFSEICLYLNIQDVYNLSHVNRDLNGLISDDMFKTILLQHCPYYSLDKSPHSTWKQCASSYISRSKKICPELSETKDYVVNTDKLVSSDFVSLSDTCTDSILSLGQSISLDGSTITFDELETSVDVATGKKTDPEPRTGPSFENGVYTGYHGISMRISPNIHAHMITVESPEVLAVLSGWGFNYQKLMVKYRSSEGLDPDFVGDHINILDRVIVSAGHVFLKSVSHWTYVLQDDTFIPVVYQPQSREEYPFLCCYDGLLMHFSGTTVEVYHVDLQDKEMRGGKRVSFTHSNSGFSGNLYKLSQVPSNPRYAIEYNINRTICGVWDFKEMKYMRRQYNDNRKALQFVGVQDGKLEWQVYTKAYIEGLLGRQLEMEQEVVEEYGDL